MKKILALLFTVSLIFGVAGQASALSLSIDSLQIKSTTHAYVWDTLDTNPSPPITNTFSPIGVSINGGSSIVQVSTSQSIAGLVSMDPGESILLFTEAKYPGWSPTVRTDMFTTETYQLIIKVGSTTYTGTFAFGNFGVFSVISDPIPFTLEFLGFTDDSTTDSLVDRVGPWLSTSNLGLASNGYADAVYRLTHDAPVPEPATMFLLGSGLIGIGVYARRKFKR